MSEQTRNVRLLLRPVGNLRDQWLRGDSQAFRKLMSQLRELGVTTVRELKPNVLETDWPLVDVAGIYFSYPAQDVEALKARAAQLSDSELEQVG